MRNVQFRGIKPRSKPDFLENPFASYATNCTLYDGAIRPLRDSKFYKPVFIYGNDVIKPPETLRVAGGMLIGFTQPTFHTNDTNNIAGADAFLFVENGVLKRTSPTWLVEACSCAGQAVENVGICYPKEPPIAMPTGEKCDPTYDIEMPACLDTLLPQDCQEEPEVLAFLYTYVNACGEESAPSLPSETIKTESLAQMVLEPEVNAPPNAVARKWYVAISSGEQALWHFIGEQPIEEKQFFYCHTVFSFAEILKTEDHNPPPPCIDGVVTLGMAVTAVWQGRDIWFSEPRLPNAYPDQHRQTIDDDIVGIYSFNDQSYGNGEIFLGVILTKGAPYTIRGTMPEDMTITKLNRIAPCLNPMGVLTHEGNVFYTSTDGLYRITDNTVYNITTEWFTLDEWQQLSPQEMRIAYYNDRLFAFSPWRDGLMFKYPRENNQHQYDCVYITKRTHSTAQLPDGDMVITQGRQAFLWEHSAEKLVATWRSKIFTNAGLWKPTVGKVISDVHRYALGDARTVYQQMKLEQQYRAPWYDVGKFLRHHPEYEKYYNYLYSQVITFTIYGDGQEVYSRAVRSQKPFRLKRDRRKIYWQYEVKTQVDINEIHLQTSLDDLTQEGGHA